MLHSHVIDAYHIVFFFLFVKKEWNFREAMHLLGALETCHRLNMRAARRIPKNDLQVNMIVKIPGIRNLF